eukprot:1376390-Amorphochlora_amoeboformis.AAC.2
MVGQGSGVRDQGSLSGVSDHGEESVFSLGLGVGLGLRLVSVMVRVTVRVGVTVKGLRLDTVRVTVKGTVRVAIRIWVQNATM